MRFSLGLAQHQQTPTHLAIKKALSHLFGLATLPLQFFFLLHRTGSDGPKDAPNPVTARSKATAPSDKLSGSEWITLGLIELLKLRFNEFNATYIRDSVLLSLLTPDTILKPFSPHLIVDRTKTHSW